MVKDTKYFSISIYFHNSAWNSLSTTFYNARCQSDVCTLSLVLGVDLTYVRHHYKGKYAFVYLSHGNGSFLIWMWNIYF